MWRPPPTRCADGSIYNVHPLLGVCLSCVSLTTDLLFSAVSYLQNLRSTVALTAGRGRGKSAALGLSLAAAVAYGYANIFVTAPSPENLRTLFEFVLKGFDALEYREHADYSVVQSTNPDLNKAVVSAHHAPMTAWWAHGGHARACRIDHLPYLAGARECLRQPSADDPVHPT